jgi:hypothetical protein
MRTRLLVVALAAGVLASIPVSSSSGSGVNCSDFATQAAAQAFFIAHGGPAQDPEGLDGDHDGIACESLPCPCNHSTTPAPTPVPTTTTAPTTPVAAPPAASTTTVTPTTTPPPPPTTTTSASCTTPVGVLTLTFSRAKYPNIRKHVLAALHDGWPRVLVVNRPGASARRARRLAHVRTRHGFDRDEYPPAEARGRGHGLTRGTNPTGWMANVRLVPSSENRSQGAVMGDDLKPYCNGTKFREVFD